MSTETVVKFFKDFKTIVVGIVAVGLTFQVWANTQYVTYAALDTREIRSIRKDISVKQTELRFTKNRDKKEQIKEVIKTLENEIKIIKGE